MGTRLSRSPRADGAVGQPKDSITAARLGAQDAAAFSVVLAARKRKRRAATPERARSDIEWLVRPFYRSRGMPPPCLALEPYDVVPPSDPHDKPAMALQLVQAVANNYVFECVSLMARGAPLEPTPAMCQSSPLFAAASCGHVHLCALLLENGAPPESCNTRGETALMMGAKAGNMLLCELLVEHGADVDAVDVDGGTALMMAASLGHAAVCEYLLQNGAAVDAVDVDGGTALMMAAACGRVDACSCLLRHGADVHRRDFAGFNAFMHAHSVGDMRVCAALLPRCTTCCIDEAATSHCTPPAHSSELEASCCPQCWRL